MSLEIYKKFEVDKDAELNGKWLPFYGAEFLLSRVLISRNKTWKLAVEKYSKLYPEDGEKALRCAFFEVGLKGWKGVTDKKGKALPFNKENVEKFFDSVPEFLDVLFRASSDMNNYLAKQEEEEIKN
jgi:hypothetical protein